MSPPRLQSVARISQLLGIHVDTLYSWRKNWRLPGEMVPAAGKDPEGWTVAAKFSVVLKVTSRNGPRSVPTSRARGIYPVQVKRWQQVAQDANGKPLLSLSDQRKLEKLRARDQRGEIKRLQRERRRKGKALAEAAAC